MTGMQTHDQQGRFLDIAAPTVHPAWRPLRKAKTMAEPTPYSATTRGIEVTVRPFYVADHSSPADGRYVFAYQVRIANRGKETVQLRNRHWRITDSQGRTQEVRGAGVVGEQPVLGPGESFEYTSGTPLATASGIMLGSYEMISEDGERFDVAIPAFSLDAPHGARRVN